MHQYSRRHDNAWPCIATLEGISICEHGMAREAAAGCMGGGALGGLRACIQCRRYSVHQSIFSRNYDLCSATPFPSPAIKALPVIPMHSPMMMLIIPKLPSH